jgi:nucleoside-diphosphate-sugar epimerase
VSTLIVGCGYLGLRIGTRLSNRHEIVYGTVRSERRVEALRRSGIAPLIVDVLDTEALKTLPRVEHVIYTVGFDRSAGIPMRRVYVEGLANVIRTIASPSVRMVYVSSTGVYGQTDGEWVDEDSPTEPTSESGKICLEAERIAGSLAKETGLELVILRLSGLYGPGRIITATSLNRLRAGEPIPGDPTKYLNMIHIDDAASATICVLDWGTAGRTYLASDDRPILRRDYYQLPAEMFPDAPPVRFQQPDPNSGKVGRDSSNKRVSNQRIKSELGFTLQYPHVLDGFFASLDMEGFE